jgi:hypothetical protein
MDVGWNDVCGIAADDIAYCWGGNENGKLGYGGGDDRSEPTPVAGQL